MMLLKLLSIGIHIWECRRSAVQIRASRLCGSNEVGRVPAFQEMEHLFREIECLLAGIGEKGTKRGLALQANPKEERETGLEPATACLEGRYL